MVFPYLPFMVKVGTHRRSVFITSVLHHCVYKMVPYAVQPKCNFALAQLCVAKTRLKSGHGTHFYYESSRLQTWDEDSRLKQVPCPLLASFSAACNCASVTLRLGSAVRTPVIQEWSQICLNYTKCIISVLLLDAISK